MHNTTPDLGLKQCKMCWRILSASKFRKGYAKCRTCYSIHTGHAPKEELPEGIKRCSECKQLLPATLEYFYVDTRYNGPRGKCKVCMDGISHEYHVENRERVRETHRIWRRHNPTRMLNQIRKARRKYPTAYTAAAQRRAARKRGLLDDLTKDEWANCLEYWQHRCCICGAQNGLWIPLCMDHWIPLSSPDCPGTTVSNVVVMCMSCNSRKHNSEPQEWLVREYGEIKGMKLFKQIDAYFRWLESK